MTPNEIGEALLKTPEGASIVCVIHGRTSFIVLRTDELRPGAARGVWTGIFPELETPSEEELRNGISHGAGQDL